MEHGQGRPEKTRLLREPTKEEDARWEAFSDSAHSLTEAALVGDKEGFEAASHEMRQISGKLDAEAFLNAVHVPKDAGEQADVLKRIIERIPEGWGRWISCDKGWYRLIAQLDAELAKIAPDYEVHQIKEKYGVLVVYADPLVSRPINKSDPEPPLPLSDDFEDAEWQAYEAWEERQKVWRESQEGLRCVQEAELIQKAFDASVSAAERASAKICEICGAAGRMCQTSGRFPWYKTLCKDCSEKNGYIPSKDQRHF